MDRFSYLPGLVFGSQTEKPNTSIWRFVLLSEIIAACPQAMKNIFARNFLLAFEFHFRDVIDAAIRTKPMYRLWSVDLIKDMIETLRKTSIEIKTKTPQGQTGHLELTKLYDDAIASLQAHAPEEADLFSLQVGRIYAFITLPPLERAISKSAP